MDCIFGLPILMKWKKTSYNLIIVIIDWLLKIIYYKPVKVIIIIIVRHCSLLDLIITYRILLFTLKLWSFLL